MDSTQCDYCELLENCGFYWNFKDHPEVKARLLEQRFCLNAETSKNCARIRHIKEEDRLPPATLSPDGNTIERMEARRRLSVGTYAAMKAATGQKKTGAAVGQHPAVG